MPKHRNITHTALAGSADDNPYQYVGKYGYYTHYQEPDFKLLQLGVRYYDPSKGRFTQEDPVQDGMNWYLYAAGNPLRMIDPAGLAYYWEDPVKARKRDHYSKCVSDCAKDKDVKNRVKGTIGRDIGTFAGACLGTLSENPVVIGGSAVIGNRIGDTIDEILAQYEADLTCRVFCAERKSRGRPKFNKNEFLSWYDNYYTKYRKNSCELPIVSPYGVSTPP